MIERARRDGARLDTIARRCRAREAGAGPQSRWVCCSPIDGGTTRFARDCQCSASVRWSHGWSTASMRRHGTIGHARWDGATLNTTKRPCRAQKAGTSLQARWVCCSPVDGGTTRLARDWPVQRKRALEPRLEHRQCEAARHKRARALGRRDTRHHDATVPSSGGGRQPPDPLGVL